MGDLDRTLARTNSSRERQAAERHFESVASRYEALRETDHDAVLLIGDRLPNEPLLGVDVGAGTGRYTELLRRVAPTPRFAATGPTSSTLRSTASSNASATVT
jgi:ubiquinone/menaquinone biosynthesis C-methylase UbiE